MARSPHCWVHGGESANESSLGLPPAAESLGQATDFGSLPPDCCRVGRAVTTVGRGHIAEVQRIPKYEAESEAV
jgi:hypothetical protein